MATAIVPPVSLVLATQTNRYIKALTATRDVDAARAGLVQWVDLFVGATASACRDSAAFARDLADLERHNRARAGRVRRGSAVDLMLTAIPALPVFTVKTAAELIGRSEVAVGQAVTRMMEVGVIRQVNVGRRNRAFEVVGLFEAFAGFERQLASPDSGPAGTRQASDLDERQPPARGGPPDHAWRDTEPLCLVLGRHESPPRWVPAAAGRQQAGSKTASTNGLNRHCKLVQIGIERQLRVG